MHVLRDKLGKALVLRGTNVGEDAKHATDFSSRLARADFVRLRDELGFDAIRLLVFWEAIEPERGAYDARYLERVRARVRELGELGFRVVIDMHQDVFGAGFGYAGFPEWVLPTKAYRGFVSSERWQMGYFSAQVSRAFDAFWSDEGLWERYARAWAEVVRVLAQEEAVVLYDVFNEPFWGTRSPPTFEREVLPRFYECVARAIRAIDTRTTIALSPAPHTNIGAQSRLELPSVGGPFASAPHMYPISFELGVGYDGDQTAVQTHVERMQAGAERLGVPCVVTELGARNTDRGATAFLRDAMTALHNARISAFHWEATGAAYSFWDPARAYTPLAEAFISPAAPKTGR